MDVLFDGGCIKKIGPAINEHADEVINGNGNYLAPGFIDLHIHGLRRWLIDNGPADLLEICKTLPEFGVTGFLPTVCPRPKGQDAKCLAELAEVNSPATEILGFHLEGPFLTLTGALPKDALGAVDLDRVKALISAAGKHRAIFSIAPDFTDIEKILPTMVAAAGVAFITHNRANAAQAQRAVDLGARHGTHFYDVFPIPEVTEPGVRPCGSVEVLLSDERASVDFILDGEHVEPIAVKLALVCKSPDRVCLITDSNIGTALPPGRYGFMGSEVDFAYEGAPARLTEKTEHPGCLAGSGLTMIQAVRNAIKMLGLPLHMAVRMASANPAQTLGLSAHKGQLAESFDADAVLLDKDLKVLATFVAGKKVFHVS
jgi:N-acetylglucosamine-6-phosphate deacetylase